jgi:PAS domain S-box-containing protein
MPDKEDPFFGEDEEENSRPRLMDPDTTATESIDLEGLFREEPTDRRSFHIKGVERTSFGKLLRSLPLPAILVDRSNSISVVNDAWEKICPDYESIVGNAFAWLFPNLNEAAKAEDLIEKIFEDRKPKVMQGVLQIDKTKIWARVNLRAVKLGDERGILALVEDLTGEKKQLVLNEKYRKLVNIFPFGIAEFTLAEPISVDSNKQEQFKCILSAVMIDGNNEFARVHGLSSIAEIKGQRLGKLLVVNQETHNLVVEWLSSGYRIRSGETKQRRTDGSVKFIETTFIGTVRNKSLLGFWVLRRDVTDRKQAEDELHRANELQRQLLATAATGIFTVSSDRRITAVNDEFLLRTGYSRDEVVGKPCSVFSGDECEDHCPLLKNEESDRIFRRQCVIKAKDGSMRTVLKNANVLRDDQKKVIGGIESFVDVSELIEARESAVKANKAKSDFLATMSHEIRTPLHGIIANTELALSTDMTDEQRDYLDSAKSSASFLLTLINDLLDYSKIEAGQLQLHPSPFRLREQLGDLVGTIAAQAHQKGLELAYRVAPDVPDGLIGDPDRLKQIILNLAGNAVKFTESGEVVISVDVDSVHDGKARLKFSVTDTGIGIPTDKQGEIFKAFRQVDVSFSRKYGGTGLGLAISSQLVVKMGGRIWVESEEGKGSVFRFTAAFGRSPAKEDRSFDTERHSIRGRSVLIAEDNATSRNILAEMVLNFGMQPLPADSGIAAEKIVERLIDNGQAPDVILVDEQLSDMPGSELAEWIKEETALISRTVMMLSELGRSRRAVNCEELGVSGFVVKPISESDLYDSILVALDMSEKQRPNRAATALEAFRPNTESLHILLAEDNPVNQKVAVKMLEKMGHTVAVANNGKAALECFSDRMFDLILMDVQMPEMDGLETTRIIRDREKGTGRRIPILAVTAHAMNEDRERCFSAGMDGYFSKPIDPRELHNAIERVLVKSDKIN